MTTVEQLLLIVDRAERGSMLADEAAVLRAGIRELAAGRERLQEKYRALDRAHALGELWDGDATGISRSEAAALFVMALQADGWTESEPPPGLTVVREAS